MTEDTNSDAQTTLSQLRDEVQKFAQERDWEKYHTPKNLGMSIAIEAAEIMENFQWHSSEKSTDLIRDEEINTQVADELADVVIYCLILANQADIDISSAVRAKMERNRKRYPVGFMPTSE